ncbi:MAG: hypothetical protein A2087_10450 [Spirochaetes bacterium GWD1_61_31]|nr:MAG: hypothetical protein A2Y37_12065 [Spirochaetes bacterium GWB1_60_80]OHD30114.1 MAG: hypothetical protein A2004_13925 [Spirochaetes bacterium GWC1_61_12]OHD34633.1 MAG: hypothetical protein A2087_10450 [Spirochaetes bacterium GWD1_61_31]OHD46449.1 MAG: hypothetical protein A2Y35_10355 [Spirochaetes bacterium GWE1_60_18]OHD59504.1 MAG: hypothetical protein A2Y32_10310 [Spirochaetes bacterium GWF1_60_12]
MTIEKLNGLSIEALYSLAEKVGLDLPVGLEPMFIIGELIEAFDEDSKDRRMAGHTAVHIEEKKFSGSELDEIDASLDAAACIENRYNETNLQVLVRDPGWAFVFWDIRDEELETLQLDSSFGGLFLRVIEAPGSTEATQFDVTVGRQDSSWYIHLPEPDTWYSIELCAKKTRPVTLAKAPLVRTPGMLSEATFAAMDEFSTEMAILSGIATLDVMPASVSSTARIMDEFNV